MRLRDRRRTVATALAAALAGALLTAGSAGAAEAPGCWNAEVWARPGLTRTYELYCQRVDTIEVVAEPHATRLEGLAQGTMLKFRLTPDADAPELDTFTLKLTGPGGSRDETVSIHNVPLSRNTAPRCEPASVAQRTGGQVPEAVSFHVLCWDTEHDDYTLYGGGPGSFPDAPLHNDGGMGGQGVPQWRYVPTIASGQEQATYYAIDALGARSADAPISVQVGPAVDRPPTCRPNPSSGNGADYYPIVARPGATRRFGVICEDPDDDALTPRIQLAPALGDLTRFQAAPASHGWWGNEVWVDVAYVPRGEYDGLDRFAIGADGPRGDGPLGSMAIVTRRLPENVYGGSCGWSGGGGVKPGETLTVWANCTDDEGDPLHAEVVSPPAHGTLAEPVAGPGEYGADRITVDYTPAAGFEGTDAFSIAVGDGLGHSMTLDSSVTVSTDQWRAPPIYTIGTPFDWPELHPPPTGATWLPAIGQASPVTPIEQARRALGKRSVRLVKRIGDARVYALRSALPTSAAPRRALALTCPVRCTVTSSGSVAGANAGSAKLTVKPGRASAVTLRLSSAQRRRIKRAGSARAVFRLKVARAERSVRRGTVQLSVRG
jgi:hypothetical protein